MKARRIVAIMLIILIPVCLVSCNKRLDEHYYRVTDNGVAISHFEDRDNMTVYVIPDEIEGLPVTEIMNFGVVNTETLETIRIGANVVTIGEWGLTNNMGLKAFEVDERNTAFKAVDGVLFNFDMTEIVAYPCAREGAYTIPDTVTSIRTKAFYKCTKLAAITIPSSVVTIGEKAFMGCKLMTSITVPEGVKTIGFDAFTMCEEVTSISLPSTITYVDDYAFYNCTKVNKMTVGVPYSQTANWGHKWWPVKNGDDIPTLTIEYAGEET